MSLPQLPPHSILDACDIPDISPLEFASRCCITLFVSGLIALFISFYYAVWFLFGV